MLTLLGYTGTLPLRPHTLVEFAVTIPLSTLPGQGVSCMCEKPEDDSTDRLRRERSFARMIERGLADSKAGRTISNEEMGRLLESWGKPPA